MRGAARRGCPACGHRVRAPRARWCGWCGATLEPAVVGEAAGGRDGRRDGAPPRRGWRRLAIGGTVAVVVVAGVVAGRTELELTPPGIAGQGDDPTHAELPSTGEVRAADTARQLPPAPGDRPRCVDGADCVAWQVDLAEVGDPLEPQRGAAIVDGVLVLVGGDGVEAVDVASGDQRWRVPRSAAGGRVAGLAGGDGLVALTDGTGGLRVVDARDGEASWTREGAELGVVGAVARHGDTVLVVASDLGQEGAAGSVVAAFGVDDGELRWREEAEFAALTDAGPVVGTPFEELRLLSAADGTLRWERPLTTVLRLQGIGPVVVLTDAERRLVIDAARGEELTELGRSPSGTQVFGPPPTLLAGLDRAALIEPEGLAWTIEVPAGVCCGGYEIRDDEVVLQLLDGRTRTVSRSSGAIRSSRAPPGEPVATGTWRVGGLLVVPGEPTDEGMPWLDIRDGRTRAPWASAPAGWPVPTPDGDLVLVTPEWVARLRAPD